MADLFLIICRWPRLTVACVFLLTLAAAAYLPSLDIELSLAQRFMSGPAMEAYDDLLRTFGPEPALVVFADGGSGEGWSDEYERSVAKLAHDIGEVPGVLEVMSVAGVPGVDLQTDVLKRLPYVRKRLISRDGTGTLIVIKPEVEALSPSGGLTLTKRVENVAGNYTDAMMDIVVAGPLSMQTAAIEYSRRDLLMVSLIAIAVITLLLGVSFRSPAAVVAPLAVAVITVAVTLGILAFAKVALSQFALIAVPVLVGLSVLDGVHIVHAFLLCHPERAKRVEGSLAVKKARDSSAPSLRSVGRNDILRVLHKELVPCIWTSLTTLIGFAVLVTADISQVRSVGLVIALGVPISFILSFTLLPSILELTARGRTRMIDPFARWSTWLALFVNRRCRAIVITCVALTLVASAGMIRLHVALDFPKLFRNDVPAQVAMNEIEDRFGSSASFELVLSTDHPQGFLDPEMIRHVAHLSTALRLSANVVATVSYLDVGLAGAVVNGMDPSLMKLTPVSTNRLLYDVKGTDAGSAMMSSWLADDAKRARVHVALSGERPESFGLLQLALTNLASGFQGVMTIVPTGFAYLYKSMERVIMESFMRTFAYALVGIVCALIVIARGLRSGLAGVAANLMPIGIVLGIMGWLGVGVSVGLVILPAVGLGLMADDTIHFIMALKRSDSIEHAYRASGWPIVLTQLILLAAFGSLAASYFSSNVTLALFMCLLLIIGLAFDLLFVPAVLTLKKSYKSVR